MKPAHQIPPEKDICQYVLPNSQGVYLETGDNWYALLTHGVTVSTSAFLVSHCLSAGSILGWGLNFQALVNKYVAFSEACRQGFSPDTPLLHPVLVSANKTKLR